jgi:ABC-type uncharacterized transport system permease subunit
MRGVVDLMDAFLGVLGVFGVFLYLVIPLVILLRHVVLRSLLRRENCGLPRTLSSNLSQAWRVTQGYKI